MPDITKGKIFSSGDTVTASDLNSLVDDSVINSSAITESKIAAGAVTNAKIASSAGIGLAKLASGTDGQIPICSATGVPTFVTQSGDVTVSNAGVTTLGANKVALPMIAAGTEGDILYFGAVGAASLLAKGAASQTLKMNSTALAPEWVTVSQSTVGTLLAHTFYDPASVATYSLTTSYADIDATNITVTFTAPASGNVLIRVSATVDEDNVEAYSYMALHDGSANVTGTEKIIRRASINPGSTTPAFIGTTVTTYKLTGLSGSKTMTVRAKANTTGPDIIYGGDYPAFLIEVIEL